MSDPGTYLGVRLPPYMKPFSKNVGGVSKNAFRLMIQLAVNLIEKRPIIDGALQKIESQIGATEHLEELFAGVYFLINTFLRQPPGTFAQDSLGQDLRDLKMNEECISDLTSVLYGPKRGSLDKSLAMTAPKWPSIATLDWRLDMIVSESVSKVFEPCLLLEMTLTDGSTQRFHVSMRQFHKLRHRVAALLAEMASLEKRSYFSQ